jgi:hypothetical protein
MWMLLGFQNLLLDLNINKNKTITLADKIIRIQIELVKQWAEFGVDGRAHHDPCQKKALSYNEGYD